MFFALRGCLAKIYNEGMLPSFHPTYWPDFRIGFGWENEGLWTRVLHRSCSCVCELDVRLLNPLIGPLQLTLWSISWDCLSLGCCSVCVQILGLGFGDDFVLTWRLI